VSVMKIVASRLSGLRAAVPMLIALLTLVALPVFAFPAAAQAPDRVRVQLRWLHQAQFVGFYVALHKGFYASERIDADLIEGGPAIDPLKVLTAGQADVAIGWLPSAIDARMRGETIINIAQILRQPGLAVVCRRDAGVQSLDDIAGKVIGVWNIGDELDVRHWLRSIKIPIGQVTVIQQRPDGQDLIEKRAACVTAMMYNEYWSILRAGLAPSDLFQVRLSDDGIGFLEDGLYTTEAAVEDPRRRDVLARFLRATIRGWRYAESNVDEAFAITMAEAPRSDPIHQRRMLGSILELLGDTAHVGLVDLPDYRRSIDVIAEQTGQEAAVRAAAINGWTHRLWYEARTDAGRFLELSEATRYFLKSVVDTKWFYALDLIGTAAFGFAGFMRAQQRRYDLWGALILTFLPAVGGGTVRDLLIGGARHPPFIFRDPTYVYIVLGIVIFGTLISRFLTTETVSSRNFERTLTIFDTIGLATFTIIGAQVAIIAELNWFWVPFCAALTCAGGGMLLDIVTGREPRTFQGEPYEEIAVLGGVLLLAGLCVADRFEHQPLVVAATIAGTLVTVFALRITVVTLGLRSYRLGTQTEPAK
jgi:NitT/TauT family transport system substrate-binding protein